MERLRWRSSEPMQEDRHRHLMIMIVGVEVKVWGAFALGHRTEAQAQEVAASVVYIILRNI
jgi:hypothetical protein